MKKAIIFLLSFYSCVGFAEPQQARSDYSIEESQAKVNKILHTTSLYRNGLSYNERVAEISSRFLGTPYQAHTLIGSSSMQERLVTNPSTVDCFTFLIMFAPWRTPVAGKLMYLNLLRLVIQTE